MCTAETVMFLPKFKTGYQLIVVNVNIGSAKPS